MVNDMSVGKKVTGAFAIIIVLVAISVITIPALAASGNGGPRTSAQAGASDETRDMLQTRTQTRLRDGSCGNEPNVDTVDGSQQNRFGYGAANLGGRSAAQHGYQHGNASPPS